MVGTPVIDLDTRGDNVLPVAEIFGPTFQGEGPSTGRLAAFVRLGGCNLTCRACDTKFTWDASSYDLRHELAPMTVADIRDRIADAPLVVVTGGEPMLYLRRTAFVDLLTHLALTRQRVEVETNGTLPPSGPAGLRLLERGNLHWNVSPKLDGPMSVDASGRRLRPDALRAYADLAEVGRAVWKLVVATPGDVDQALHLVDQYQVPRDRVWLMPEGSSAGKTLDTARAIRDAALAAGVNLSLRQHLLLWPDTERGH